MGSIYTSRGSLNVRDSFSAEFSITAVNAAISANDVMGVAQELVYIGPHTGGEIIITSTQLWVYHTALISGETSYNLHLYNVTPPSAHADNDAWDLPSGDRAAYLGYVALGTPVDLGSTLYVEVNGLNKQITGLSNNTGSLWAELVTVGAFTPTAAVRRVRVHSIAV